MDCEPSLNCCRLITSNIEDQVIIQVSSDDITVEQSQIINAQFHASFQDGIEQVSSRRFNVQQPTKYSANESFEDALPSLSYTERQISFSWPSSPQANVNIADVPSLDHAYIHKRCLPNQQDQVASRLKENVPFLLRIHSGHFHIYLGLCSQTVLWKTLKGESSLFAPFLVKFPTDHFTLGLWFAALISYLLISGTYLLKCLFYFETVQMEYRDRVRVNYFFIPWIAGMLLRIGLPSNIAPDKVHPVLWCIFMAPIIILEIKIYGQWFTKGKRSLARIANPSTHLSVIGNFVVARLATRVEWREFAVFFFTVGFVHYTVIFVTLYQRFSSDITVSRNIWPVFFLFVAAPSSASVAWEAIAGSFDTVCKMLLFLSLFLYSALILRLILFRHNTRRFSVIWWACAYPMTTTSVAAIKYAEEVRHTVAWSLALVVCSASIVMVLILTVFTATIMVVARNRLFPKDTVLIMCTEQRRKVSLRRKKCGLSSDSKIRHPIESRV